MVKYGDNSNYKHKLEYDKLKWLTSKTNRSKGQTQFLFQLVDGDFSKLKKLEEQIKNTFTTFCPSTFEEVNELLDKKVNNKYYNFRLDEF